jgi:GNAT superfamily N-acetyltransferase
MNNRPSFDWPKSLKLKLNIFKAENIPSWYFLFFYKQVGKKYYWTDWLDKTEKELNNFVNDKNVIFYTLIKDGWPAGFFMLDYRVNKICNLSFLGLVEEAIGLGLGKYLLKTAILTAWDSNKIETLTVNTCSLDHKHALYLYQKNGFIPVEYRDFEKHV